MRAAGYEKHKGADGKITYIIDMRITDSELKQIYEELGVASPTEENISATPTFQRIMDLLYAQRVKIDEEIKKERRSGGGEHMRRSSAERQRLRAAKRNNRLRRLTRWKTGKTYHGTIKKIVRQYNKIIKTPRVYCSTETFLQEMSVTEAAKRLMWAEPSPSVPVMFVMDESDAEEWKRAGTRQRPDEWNPDEREAQP